MNEITIHKGTFCRVRDKKHDWHRRQVVVSDVDGKGKFICMLWTEIGKALVSPRNSIHRRGLQARLMKAELLKPFRVV